MKHNERLRSILGMAYHYFVFFLLVAFVVTCCMLLFLTTLGNSLGISFTDDNISAAARITFRNVLLISLLFTVLDTVRRKLTVERPVKRIAEAAEKIVKGDFSVRVKHPGRVMVDENFNKVIECFNKMAQELGSIETLRTDFVANVSHEMKTPLSVIQNYGTLLQAPYLSEEKRLEYAKGVTDGARRLSDMMTNILKLTRLENQNIYPAKKEFNLGEQICECLLQYENVWEKADIKIETDIAEDVIVEADAELLGHVWSNLFSNAFKFTPSGGTVSVTMTATKHHATVTVKDTGCGMTSETGTHIFEKFYQGDTSRAVQGNGLGLALVKRVIDIVQGEISVESREGVGSEFTVRLRRR